MMATLADILRDVQYQLRIPQDTDVTTQPNLLLTMFINNTLRDFSNVWMWSRYKELISRNTSDDAYTVALANSTSDQTKILAAWNTTDASPLYLKPVQEIIANQIRTTPNKGTVSHFAWKGEDTVGATVDVHIYPRASGTQALKFWIYNPPARLAVAATSNTVINAPEFIVLYGVVMQALIERGEDGGKPFEFAKMAYDKYIADLLGTEQYNATDDEFTWT